MRQDGEELKLIRMGATGRVVDELQGALLTAQESALAGVTLRELAERMGGGDESLAQRQEF
jgi:hypothetical protein